MGIECGCKSDNCCHEKSFFEKYLKNPQIEPILEAETDSKRRLPNIRNIIERNNMPCDMTKTNKLLDEINKIDTKQTNHTINGMSYVTRPCGCDEYENISLNKQNKQNTVNQIWPEDNRGNDSGIILITILFSILATIGLLIFGYYHFK